MGNCKSCGNQVSGAVVATPLTAAPSRCSSCSQPAASCGCDRFCEEDHTQTKVYKNFGFTLRAVDGFVWPNVAGSVTFHVDSADRVAFGSVLWLTGAGYLHVTSFDFSAQTITAKNNGEACNTFEGGEAVTACSDFVVTAPACLVDHAPLPNTPYLAADFIDPGNGLCQAASVTNVVGLTVNDTIFLAGYSYRLGNIYDNQTVQLCNDGDGASLGTTINWDENNDGIEDKPLIKTASENPCSRVGVQAGQILACSSGVAHPLQGTIEGQIPVWNVDTGRFILKLLSLDLGTCSVLTADLVLDPVHVGSYAVTVVDSSFFGLKIIKIAEKQFIVNTVDSPTTMHITPVVVPGTLQTIPHGTAVCVDPDPTGDENCTILTGSFTVPASSSAAIFFTVNDSSRFIVGQIIIINGVLFVVTVVNTAISITAAPYVQLAAPTQFLEGSLVCISAAGEQQVVILSHNISANATYITASQDYTFRNPSTRKNAQVRISLDFFFDFFTTAGAGPPNYSTLVPKIQDNINAGGWNDASSYHLVGAQYVSGSLGPFAVALRFERLLHLAPFAVATYSIRGSIFNSAAGATATIDDGQTLKSTFLIVQP